eukprot:m.34148 g.34148  ORF g.34148 m.34148 type:complete len:133 (-) comp10638_c0_seq1:145-543(-)
MSEHTWDPVLDPVVDAADKLLQRNTRYGLIGDFDVEHTPRGITLVAPVFRPELTESQVSVVAGGDRVIVGGLLESSSGPTSLPEGYKRHEHASDSFNCVFLLPLGCTLSASTVAHTIENGELRVTIPLQATE